ncbi:Universal stress protein [Micromonospora sp. MW-13]|uniref:universal stress protein n=1 Tax=Micromonospora sp. MW-13 TaxID=2094022 RepID=UPI000E4321AB|nr:universal stress protein [Micromonospora sp. MW-13]RGC65356.1 Universal stress protein [Micromonospora sp. MW-13]
MSTVTPILIAYDGSPNARAAIDTVAEMFPGARAVVLYARQPLEGLAAHLEGHPAVEQLRGLDASTLDASERLATEGAALAERAGLTAEPRVASTMATPAEAIVQTAEDDDAQLIVLGSHGRTGLKAALLGSTSIKVLHHTRRPTLVIPATAAEAG